MRYFIEQLLVSDSSGGIKKSIIIFDAADETHIGIIFFSNLSDIKNKIPFFRKITTTGIGIISRILYAVFE